MVTKMVTPYLPPIASFPGGPGSYPRTITFAYQEGEQLIGFVERLRQYVVETLVNDIDADRATIIAAFDVAVNTVIGDVNTALVSSRSYVDAAVASIINSTIEVTDTIIAASFNRADSATRLAADPLYSNKATQTAVTTGRLSFKNISDMVGLNVKDYGAKGDGVTDDTVAIQSAVNAAIWGQTILFPSPGAWNKFYLISAPIIVTTPSLRFLGGPRDSYGTKILAQSNITMFIVKTTGVTFQKLGFAGSVGFAVNGIEFFGDIDGNGDSITMGCTFERMVVCVKTLSRNNTFTDKTLFSISNTAILIDGPDPVYHTGAGATGNMRGNNINNCWFHGVANGTFNSIIHVTPEADVLYLNIQHNTFDGGGNGVHVFIDGSSTRFAQRVVCQNNIHYFTQGTPYRFINTRHSTINNASIFGDTAGTNYSDNAIELTGCLAVTVSDVTAHHIGKSGIIAKSSSTLRIRDSLFYIVGLDGTVSHGLDIDSTNSGVKVSNVSVLTATGWGFTGDPVGGALDNCNFDLCTLGTINSTVVTNAVSRGNNVTVEGRYGNIEDTGYKFVEFTAGVAKVIADVQAASNFGSAMFEVTFTARDGVSGNCYADIKRYVRMGNGTPVIATIGTDALALVTVTVAAQGTSSVAVSLTTNATVSGSVVVRAFAGGGTASDSTVRGARVIMR